MRKDPYHWTMIVGISEEILGKKINIKTDQILEEEKRRMVKCDLCEKYQMPAKDFSGENDAHLVQRIFFPDIKTCQCCNDIIDRGFRFSLTKMADQFISEWDPSISRFSTTDQAYIEGAYDFSDWLKSKRD